MKMNSNLHKDYKRWTKASWKKQGLLWTSQEEFEEIYQRYITSTHCELCKEPYKSSRDRQMDHEHSIDNKWGWFRNIVCRSCNQLKSGNKMPSNNTSGYRNITKHFGKTYKRGFFWDFKVIVNGKRKTIKSSVNLNKLVKFADKWKIDHDYNT